MVFLIKKFLIENNFFVFISHSKIYYLVLFIISKKFSWLQKISIIAFYILFSLNFLNFLNFCLYGNPDKLVLWKYFYKRKIVFIFAKSALKKNVALFLTHLIPYKKKIKNKVLSIKNFLIKTYTDSTNMNCYIILEICIILKLLGTTKFK